MQLAASEFESVSGVADLFDLTKRPEHSPGWAEPWNV